MEKILICNCCGRSDFHCDFRDNQYDLLRCGNCGLRCVDQSVLNVNAQKMTTDPIEVTRAAVHQKGEMRRAGKIRHFVDIVKKCAPTGQWLDIGCGTGTLIRVAKQSEVEISGIELSPERRELAIKSTAADIYDQPVESLDFETEAFSAVLMIDVFSHLINPAETFACVHRILAKGGIFLIYTSEIGEFVEKHHNPHWSLGDHLFFLGDRTIEQYADKIGFEVIRREKQWAPELFYSREHLLEKGRSRLRNFIKQVIVYTPGLLRLMRWYLIQFKNKNNSHYISTIVLKKKFA